MMKDGLSRLLFGMEQVMMWLKSQQVLHQAICHISSDDQVECRLNKHFLYSLHHRSFPIIIHQLILHYCASSHKSISAM